MFTLDSFLYFDWIHVCCDFLLICFQLIVKVWIQWLLLCLDVVISSYIKSYYRDCYNKKTVFCTHKNCDMNFGIL